MKLVKPTLSPEDPGDEVVGDPKVGTLRNLDDDGSENVAKKNEFAFFQS